MLFSRFYRQALHLSLLFLLFGLAAPPSARAAGPFPQRRINEFAATLERARRALIEETGLRPPGEPMARYLTRLAQPLPGEKPEAFRTRIESYLTLLAKAADETASIRRMPSLRDRSPANVATWQRASRALGFLPERIAKLREAWRKPMAEQNRPPSASRSKLPNQAASELDEALHLVIVGADDLRDALP